MKHSLRIAVLSDQHIDREADAESWELAKRAFKAAVAEKVDHVILAGDTFDCASAMLRDRAVVERYLKRLGLWRRDRLTIVVGNYDIFHTAHRGSWGHRVAEFTKAASMDAQEMYDEFTGWAAQVTQARDRLAGAADLYPLEKRLGDLQLWAVDTTAAITMRSGNGYWHKADDDLLRDAAENGAEHRVLVTHHSPFADDERRLR